MLMDTVLLCRAFEETVRTRIGKTIHIPVYLSSGQEMIPAAISEVYRGIKPLIFAQHRAHSWYLSFGGKTIALIDELLGLETGCAKGMGGSASIHCPEINMYGHDGMMGSNVPIAVGACYTSMRPTIAVVGDAAAEEDYVLTSLGWAATKKLPILFIVEDNNLSILTEKKIRRSWNIADVANAMGVEAYDIDDDPEFIFHVLTQAPTKPMLLNINTTRKYWHCGNGIDGTPNVKEYDLDKHIEALEIIWKQREMLLDQ